MVCSILETANFYLIQEVAPKANEIDSSPEALLQALQGLGNLGLLGLRVPQKWGGKEVNQETLGNFHELVARYSGALAFLQTQHQSATGMLAASSNYHLQQQYLPQIQNNQIFLGIGFSQLRRGGKPPIVATPVEAGYQLDGVVPWVTGYNLFSEFIVAATLPDGGAVFGIVPLKYQQNLVDTITFSQPAQLAAMASTNTVATNFKSYFLTNDLVVSVKEPGWIHKNDQNNVLQATFLATGCSLAGLDIIKSIAEKKSLSFIDHAFDCLDQELNTCRTTIRTQQNQSLQFAEKLQLRAWAIELMGRITQAAVTVSSGGAIYKHHNAQRIYREALVFAVTGQTTAVMEATLRRLVGR